MGHDNLAILLTAIIFTVAAGTAKAGSDAKHESEGFSAYDKDDSGYITKEEVGNDMHLGRMWPYVDQNSDDRIDRAEFSAFEEAKEEDLQTMPEAVEHKEQVKPDPAP